MDNSTNRCNRCPRAAERDNKLQSLEAIREHLVQSASSLLDEPTAQNMAKIFHIYGIITDPTDITAVRKNASEALAALENIEDTIAHDQEEDSRHCVGALTLRATDVRTQYDVTICRSPNNTEYKTTESAVVKKRRINE